MFEKRGAASRSQSCRLRQRGAGLATTSLVLASFGALTVVAPSAWRARPGLSRQRRGTFVGRLMPRGRGEVDHRRLLRGPVGHEHLGDGRRRLFQELQRRQSLRQDCPPGRRGDRRFCVPHPRTGTVQLGVAARPLDARQPGAGRVRRRRRAGPVVLTGVNPCGEQAQPGQRRRDDIQREALRHAAGDKHHRHLLQQDTYPASGDHDPTEDLGQFAADAKKTAHGKDLGFVFSGQAGPGEATWQFDPWAWSNGGSMERPAAPLRCRHCPSSPAW